MNIKQLEVFVAIVDSGSFSKGAEMACITQSTASQHIAALESAAGVRLLDRTGRGALPTEAGKVMLMHARRVLSALEMTEHAILRFCQAEGVELRVAGSSIPATYILPKVIGALLKRADGLRVNLELSDSSGALALLQSESAEVALVGKKPDERLFDCEPVGNDNVSLLVCRGHSWCHRSSIDIRELLAEPLVMSGKGSGTRSVVVDALRKVGVVPEDIRTVAVLSGSESVKQAVLSGCGAAFLSETAVLGELSRGELAKVKVEGLEISRPFFLATRKGRTLSPAAGRFCAALKEELNQ